MNSLFKLPGGRSIPMQRAISMGLADSKGNPAKPAMDSQGEKLLRKEQKQAEWAAKQAGKPLTRSVRSIRRVGTGTPEDPALTEDGILKRKKREPKPLVPQNVTPDGEPITDEETLAEIAAKTAAIEAAKAAED